MSDNTQAEISKEITKNKGRLDALDALRGLAAIGIAFFWHYVHFRIDYFPTHRDAFPFYTHFSWLYDYAYNFVDFFFVLSGFVFMRTYAHKIINHQITFREFAIKRLSRLYPLHFLTLLVVGAEVAWMQLHGHSFIYQYNDFFHFILSLLLLQSGWFDTHMVFNGPSWSIATEIIVYLLFFATLSRLKVKFHYNIAFLIFIYIGTALMNKGDEYLILNSFTQRALLGFFAGCLTFQAVPFVNYSRKTALIYQVLFIVGAVVLTVISRKIGFEKFFGRFDLVFPLTVYPAVILFVLENAPTRYVLSLAPFRILGHCSYSIYLWHYPIQTILHSAYLKYNIAPETHEAAYIYFACVLAIAIPSYYLFEKPVQDKIRAAMLPSWAANR